MSRPLSHRHALRAALAVTGCARRPLIHTALVCALATSPLACAQTSEPKPDPAPTSSTPAADSEKSTPVVNDETTTSPRADCVDDTGQTSWECCVENRLDADGCDICEERFGSSDRPDACLSCGYFDRDVGMCCPDVINMMEEVGLSNEGDPLGCAPWGPPAPPAYSARTLNNDSPPCPSHFRRERRSSHATA